MTRYWCEAPGDFWCYRMRGHSYTLRAPRGIPAGAGANARTT
jgi:hypothetical protein